MNLKDKTYEEILFKHKQLLKEKEILDKKLTAVYNKKRTFEEERDKIFANAISEDPEKVTPAQWAWILEHGHHSTAYHYEITAKYIEKLGFYHSGFWEDTKQVNIVISRYGFKKKKKLISKGFQIVNPHLKAVTHEGKNMGKQVPETGTCYEVHSWEEDSDERLVLYARTSLTIGQKPFVLYTSNYASPGEFNSFDEFLDFYETVAE